MKLWIHEKSGLVLPATHLEARSRSSAYMKLNGFRLLTKKQGAKLETPVRADKYYILRKYNNNTKKWMFEAISYDGSKKVENKMAEGWEVIKGKGIPLSNKHLYTEKLINMINGLLEKKEK